MPRVFISSTSRDLELYRKVAYQVIDQNQWDVEWMERFTTAMSPTLEVCRQKVLRCDLVLLLVAFRYGSCPPGSDRSYTRHEVETARQAGIPVRALMADRKGCWPLEFIETDPQARE